MTSPRRERQGPVGRQLAGARLRAGRRALAEGAVGWLAWALPGTALLFLVGWWLPPTRLASGLIAALAALWIGATLLGAGLRTARRLRSVRGYALWLEHRAGLRRNELVNALDLETDHARWQGDPISSDLLDLSLARAAETLAGLPLTRLHARRRLIPPLGVALAAGVPLLLLALLSPVRFADTLQLFTCAGSPAVVPAIGLRVTPGDARIERGGSLTVSAAVHGRRRPARVLLAVRAPGGHWTRAAMVLGSVGERAEADAYTFLLPALTGDLEYRVEAGWAMSATYAVRVIEQLQALGYRKRYEPPAYTGQQPQREVSATGDLAALTGTRVTLEVLHRRPGVTGALEFIPRARDLPLTPSDGRLHASWTLAESGAYRVVLRDAVWAEAWASDTFQVEVYPDLAPVVRLRQPAPEVEVPPDMQLVLEAEALDDFGLTELTLIYARAQEDPRRRVLDHWPAAARASETRLTHVWDLEELGLLPGQDLHYYLRVLDNDALHGPKAGETPLYTVRFPTMAELYARAEQERRGEIASLEETLIDQQALREDLRRVSQEMLREEQISWEKQQEIEDLLLRQETLAEQFEQLRESLEASAQRMENQNLFSLEVLEKVREIRELVDQVASSEFHAALEQMRNALDSLDRRDLQQAMERMRLSQEEVTTALDRTLHMLRRMLADEQLDRLVQKIAELEGRQGEINRQLEMSASAAHDEQAPDSLAGERALPPEEAAALAAEQEALERELEALRAELEKLREETAQGMPDLERALDQLRPGEAGQQLQEQMRETREALERADRQGSLKFGRKVRRDLQQLGAQLDQMRRTADVEKMEALARALFAIAHRMVAVSVRQEELARGSEGAATRDLARYQQQLYEELAQMSDSLLAVARETPVIKPRHLEQFGDALREIEHSRDAFSQGRRQRGVSLAGESMRRINHATKALLEAACQAQTSAACGASCPNPFNKMQSLTGQQSELNQATQQMLGSCQTPRLTPSQQQAMLRMAARQEMIRQGLEEIRGELEAGGQVLGQLGPTVQEMEEVTQELRRRQADRRIIERQERILSRLLTAQRSIRKQDESEERQSRTARDLAPRRSPAPIREGRSPVELLQRALLRGSQDPVPAEYRRLVERYLRALIGGGTVGAAPAVTPALDAEQGGSR